MERRRRDANKEARTDKRAGVRGWFKATTRQASRVRRCPVTRVRALASHRDEPALLSIGVARQARLDGRVAGLAPLGTLVDGGVPESHLDRGARSGSQDLVDQTRGPDCRRARWRDVTSVTS
jgi:hypothetical protein